MKTLYFDCSSGISGNMVLGALTEIISDESYLTEELKKLNVDGYRIEISAKEKKGIRGTYVDVILDGVDEYGHHHGHEHDHEHHHEHDHHHDHDHEHHHEHDHHHDHDHDHHHHHDHRNLDDVYAVIDHSVLDSEVKDLAKRIFLRVAKAESKVHGKPLSEVHFHEVGAVDSIVDIVGAAILLNRIKPDKVISSVVNDGHGFIECAHGTMSVPVPATSEILAEAGVRFRQIDVDTELVTPTGAAIIAEIADEFIPLPEMRVEKIGWGAGKKDLTIPNLLKVYLGSEQTPEKEETFMVMETNIDDCSGEVLAYTMNLLLEEGALDVFYTPVYMKKNRPAYLLTVACREEDMEKLQGIIFRETTTIGIRYRHEKRIRLEREAVEIQTPYGRAEGKKVRFGDQVYIYPEYESLKRIAETAKVPLKELMREMPRT